MNYADFETQCWRGCHMRAYIPPWNSIKVHYVVPSLLRTLVLSSHPSTVENSLNLQIEHGSPARLLAVPCMWSSLWLRTGSWERWKIMVRRAYSINQQLSFWILEGQVNLKKKVAFAFNRRQVMAFGSNAHKSSHTSFPHGWVRASLVASLKACVYGVRRLWRSGAWMCILWG